MTLGPFTVFLLSGTAELSPALYQGLPSAEQTRAGKFRAFLRKEEFLRSRILLQHLFPGHSVDGDAPGTPRWPDNYTGSITHKGGHVGLCIVEKSQARSVGIDLEAIAKVQLKLKDKICVSGELERHKRESGFAEDRLLAVIFSAKEALYKCHYPLGGRFFYFHDASLVRIDKETGALVTTVHMETSPYTPAQHQSQGAFKFLSIDGEEFVFSIVYESAGSD